MRRNRIQSSARRGCCAALLAIACALAGANARAQTPTAAEGAEELESARDAWSHKRYAKAELHYKSALDHGGLSPSDTLDAYIHLGAARASLGRKELARAAFRQAALIDVRFKTPPEAGKRAVAIARLARRDEAKLGSIALTAAIPQSVPGGESFGVDATLDQKHAAVTAKVGIDARDPVTGKHWSTSDVGATKTHFEVPASIAAPGAMLVVRIDALDPHDNRLATHEQRVRVEPLPTPPSLDLPRPTSPTRPYTREVAVAAPPPTFTLEPDAHGPAHKEQAAKQGGGFWSSPWVYLIGGAVLAAGGAFAYYELRPTDDVSLGGARVTAR